jgi:transaldolase
MSATEVTNVNPNLRKLVEAGTSPWLDLLSRSLVEDGELARLVAEDSLRGVTSNPSIFEKSILESDDYDEQLHELFDGDENMSAQSIYEEVAIHDVRGACDVLRQTYEDNRHQDGFVSLEVAADLAHDPEKTIAAAKDFWKRVDRPNLMIKIPGTKEGLGPIEEAIYSGINVNITLLFSVDAYETVADAYLKGLERRLNEGKSLDVASVASFFVSRIDTAVDKRLEGQGHDELLGTAAIANARNAYRSFERIFGTDSPRWDALHHAGAHPQRPLWASTGVKNPDYPDTMYVDELVGAHTVNTMPRATLDAVADHGTVSGPTATRNPDETLQALEQAGIDLVEVTDELLDAGVKTFEDAMSELLDGIEERRKSYKEDH